MINLGMYFQAWANRILLTYWMGDMREIRAKDDTKLLLVEGSFLLLSCGKLWEDQICGGGNEEFGFRHVNFDM